MPVLRACPYFAHSCHGLQNVEMVVLCVLAGHSGASIQPRSGDV